MFNPKKIIAFLQHTQIAEFVQQMAFSQHDDDFTKYATSQSNFTVLQT